MILQLWSAKDHSFYVHVYIPKIFVKLEQGTRNINSIFCSTFYTIFSDVGLKSILKAIISLFSAYVKL